MGPLLLPLVPLTSIEDHRTEFLLNAIAWPVSSLQKYVAVGTGAGAESGFLTRKAVCARIMLFGRTCIRTQDVTGSSIQKQANARSSSS